MSMAIAKMSQQAVGVGNGGGPSPVAQDPFTNTPPERPRAHSHRFSSFDTQLFAINHSSSSPGQTKRALEAHLVETERRLQEASKLGTALVQQRKHLVERLEEVEERQGERDIGPELRRKLAEIEKEYNEVGRETARAFIGTKPSAEASEDVNNAPFALDGRVSPMRD